MYRGRIIGELPGGASAADIGLLMAGQTLESAPNATGEAS